MYPNGGPTAYIDENNANYRIFKRIEKLAERLTSPKHKDQGVGLIICCALLPQERRDISQRFSHLKFIAKHAHFNRKESLHVVKKMTEVLLSDSLAHED